MSTPQPTFLSLLQLLTNTNHLFFIDHYQRPYSWDEEQLDDLWEDICDTSDALGWMSSKWINMKMMEKRRQRQTDDMDSDHDDDDEEEALSRMASMRRGSHFLGSISFHRMAAKEDSDGDSDRLFLESRLPRSQVKIRDDGSRAVAVVMIGGHPYEPVFVWDGQHRLITTFLLFRCLCEHMPTDAAAADDGVDGDLKADFQSIRRQLEERLVVFDSHRRMMPAPGGGGGGGGDGGGDGSPSSSSSSSSSRGLLLRLTLEESMHPVFEGLMVCDGIAGATATMYAHEKLIHAKEFFLKKLRGVRDQMAAVPARFARWLFEFYTVLSQEFYILLGHSMGSTSRFLSFTALNSRGVALSDFDKLKNYLGYVNFECRLGEDERIVETCSKVAQMLHLCELKQRDEETLLAQIWEIHQGKLEKKAGPSLSVHNEIRAYFVSLKRSAKSPDEKASVVRKAINKILELLGRGVEMFVLFHAAERTTSMPIIPKFMSDRDGLNLRAANAASLLRGQGKYSKCFVPFLIASHIAIWREYREPDALVDDFMERHTIRLIRILLLLERIAFHAHSFWRKERRLKIVNRSRDVLTKRGTPEDTLVEYAKKMDLDKGSRQPYSIPLIQYILYQREVSQLGRLPDPIQKFTVWNMVLLESADSMKRDPRNAVLRSEDDERCSKELGAFLLVHKNTELPKSKRWEDVIRALSKEGGSQQGKEFARAYRGGKWTPDEVAARTEALDEFIHGRWSLSGSALSMESIDVKTVPYISPPQPSLESGRSGTGDEISDLPVPAQAQPVGQANQQSQAHVDQRNSGVVVIIIDDASDESDDESDDDDDSSVIIAENEQECILMAGLHMHQEDHVHFPQSNSVSPGVSSHRAEKRRPSSALGENAHSCGKRTKR